MFIITTIMMTINFFLLNVVLLDSVITQSHYNVSAFSPSISQQRHHYNNIVKQEGRRPYKHAPLSSTPTISQVDKDKVTSIDNLYDQLKSKLNQNQQKCLENALEEHNEQFQLGVNTFGCSSTLTSRSEMKTEPSTQETNWQNDDFLTYSVNKGHAGPSEFLLFPNGHIIYESKNCILSNEECNDFINVAKYTIQKEKKEQKIQEQKGHNKKNGREASNADLYEARISKLPQDALDKIRTLLETKLYPLLESKYNMKDLTVYDGLILGHLAPSRSQPVHRDASLLTLNIPLSTPGQDYNGGGGTYIEGLVSGHENNKEAVPICIEKGKVICHSSGIMHAGCGIHQGERWVMVLFVIAKNEPQIARRCHAKGLYAIDDRNLDAALDEFQTGLSVAPNDHLLQMGIGQIASIQSDNVYLDDTTRKEMYQQSINCLDIAAKYYAPALRANIALGKMFLMKRKPRAALRRFDAVLHEIDNKDLVDGAFLGLKAQGWDARFCAVRCALLCAEWVINNNQPNDADNVMNESKETEKFDQQDGKWSNKLKIQEAIERLEIALTAAPDDEQLFFFMQRAKELYNLSTH